MERQIQGMSSVQLPLDTPSLEDESHGSNNLPKRIHAFCQESKEKRKYEWESLKVVLASTISAEECHLTLTEDDFLVIQKKMDKIDQILDDLYKNWHAEYRDAVSLEECNEIKKFYKPYLEKYESKYRVLYHMLQQPNSISAQESTSGMTPSLAALDNAPSLRQKEWIRGEPGDVPHQYSTISRLLTPTTPKPEDMRLDPSLNLTPEGSLGDLPAKVGNAEEAREREYQASEERPQETPFEVANERIPDTHLKAVPESHIKEAPRRIQRTREASREEAKASK